MVSVKRSPFLIPTLFLLALALTVGGSARRPATADLSTPPVTAPSPAGQQGLNCGYAEHGAEEAIANHRQHRLQAAKAGGELAVQAVAPVRLVGDLAVIEDDGGIIMQPNGFDLKNRSLLFTPDGDGYRVTAGDALFSKDYGQALTRFTGADGRPTASANNGYAEVPLRDAAFPFYGLSYDAVFVGINGYLTFGRGDTASRTSAAALAREMPRLAPLWADLDVTAEGGIYYNRLADRHLFTWAGAPQVQYAGYSTFQAALYDDGRVTFAYKKVKARNALVGLSRGGGGDAQPLDLSAVAGEPVGGAAFESFSKLKRIDIPALTQSFYAAQPDVFDTVYLWTDFAFDNGIGYATAFVVRNDIQGIGISPFDRGGIYGSPARLSSVVVGGDILRSWIDDPNAHMVGLFSPVAIVAHEQGHRWLSYIRFATRREKGHDELLGRDRNHWSFLMDSRSTADGSFSSVMEGNAWSGGDTGTFRTIESSANYFNELDQYLMGLRAAADVKDLAYVQVNETMHDALRIISPAQNFAIPGERRAVSIDQIIEQEGERVPSVETSPKEFRIAFILLTERGAAPANATLQKLETYRSALVRYFSLATARRGALVSALQQP